MNEEQIFQATQGALERLSERRGYQVSPDSVVCIFVCGLIQDEMPELRLAKIDMPKLDDFHAVLLGKVNDTECLIDPTHLVWSKQKLPDVPDINKAVLITPIRYDFNPKKAIPYWKELRPEYLEALSQFIREEAKNR
jgi:hypothetical protein